MWVQVGGHDLQVPWCATVVDAGFIERGFCNSIANENFGAMPTLAENYANFRAFLRKACPTCQSLHFQSRSFIRHAEVNHRSWFHCFFFTQTGGSS